VRVALNLRQYAHRIPAKATQGRVGGRVQGATEKVIQTSRAFAKLRKRHLLVIRGDSYFYWSSSRNTGAPLPRGNIFISEAQR